MDTRIALIAGLVIGLLLGAWLLGYTPQRVETSATLATVEELRAYDVGIGALAPAEIPPNARSARVRLPESRLYVELRGLSESEYNSFMVQGVGIEMIERQMLAAAFVAPALPEGDMDALSPDLARFLKRAVNELSGFAVFRPDL